MDHESLEQRLAFLQNGLREIGALCLRLGGDAASTSAPGAPSSSGIPPLQPVNRPPNVGTGQHDAVAATGTPLDQFLAGVQDLTMQEQLVVVDAAITMLSQVFVHLPLKRSMHGIEPIQRLRLLKLRVENQIASGTQLNSARGFHDEMIDVFHSLRDLHTNYVLPSSYQGRTAFLPFLVQEYFDGVPPQRHYIVTKVLPGFVHDTFTVGVTVTHWNGIPIERAIELNAAREAGSNSEARFARGLEALTLRPMALTAPPDEAWVIIGYESGGQRREVRFEWRVTTPEPSAAGADVDDPLSVAGEATFVMGFDAETLAVHRARRSLFYPEAVNQERHMAQVMATSVDVANLAAAQPTTAEISSEMFSFDAKGEELRKAKRAVRFHDTSAAEEAFARVAVAEAAAGADLNTTTVLPEFFAFRKVTTPSGVFGYIRIFSFMALDANSFVAEFVRIVKLLEPVTTGLIVDVRRNGGGNIRAGERLLQVLTRTRIEPERFHFINTPTTLTLCRGDMRLQTWVESIELSIQTGEIYSQGFHLTPVDSANSLAYHYPGKVVLIIDALCYSTTDIFAAGFQDHKIGKILGTSGRTGAGGANVWTYDFFTQLQGFPPLPKGVTFRTAIRRSTRVGDRIGVPLEDLGVRPDRIHKVTRNDVLSDNVDMINASGEMLVAL
jgi:hypothetical protein